jgi:predicted alpha/beta-hydrolase family hydrolase
VTEVKEVRFPDASAEVELRGIVHAPEHSEAGLVITHGRSNDLRNPLIRRLAESVASEGIWALRFNFRYVEAKGQASRDLSREEVDLRGAMRFARAALASQKIFAAGKSMGARVCARVSADPDVAGVIALGYPLHPRFRPEVLNPPEWPYLVKPALFVQGDRDPFCNLERLRSELPKLKEPADLVVVDHAGHSFEPIGAKRDTFPEVRDAILRWISRRIA